VAKFVNAPRPRTFLLAALPGDTVAAVGGDNYVAQ
jgi:hypothetical protein